MHLGTANISCGNICTRSYPFPSQASDKQCKQAVSLRCFDSLLLLPSLVGLFVAIGITLRRKQLMVSEGWVLSHLDPCNGAKQHNVDACGRDLVLLLQFCGQTANSGPKAWP